MDRKTACKTEKLERNAVPWGFFSMYMGMSIRVRPRFFDQVGHKTMYASSGNKYFFTKSCHCQTYQNYEQSPQTSQNSYFQIYFSVLKVGRIFPKIKFL